MEETNRLLRLLGVISYVTVLLYLTELFFPNKSLLLSSSILAAILLVFTTLYISAINRLVVTILILIGSICFYLVQASPTDVILGFGKNLNLLSLFLFIPLIGTFMSTAGYLTLLKQKIQYQEQRKQGHPYRLSFLLTATIGILLNFGSMAIVKKIAEESFSSYREQKLTLIIMRGFAFCMLWSPYFVNVGLVLVLFDLSWTDVGLYGMMLAIIYVGVSALMTNRIKFNDDPVINHHQTEIQTSEPSLRPLFLFGFTLVTLSFLIDSLLAVNMLTVVSMLAIFLPFLWALMSKQVKSYSHDVFAQVQSAFYRLKNELAIFISAGYFGFALSLTEFGQHFSSFLFVISLGSVFLLSLLLVLFAILLAQIAIHPVIIVIGIGSALSPEQFGVSPVYLALLLLVAWTMATLLSPFSGQVLMASRLTNKSPRILVRQNLSFVCTLSLILTTTLYLFYKLGLM